MKHYCEPCPYCDGEGGFTRDEVTHHPYGDTYAAEHSQDFEPCADCQGCGLYFVGEFEPERLDMRVDVIGKHGLRGSYFFRGDDEAMARVFAKNESWSQDVVEVQLFELKHGALVFRDVFRDGKGVCNG